MSDELTRLLSTWASQQRLTAAQVAEVRTRVLAVASDDADAALEADWLWSFLRPVTNLLEQVGGSRGLRLLDASDVELTPYLLLA
jgi:hypothetical protein